MSQFYKKPYNLYDPEKTFKISRSKIELFMGCPRCFYLDRKIGVGRPPGFPFALNSAVDTLLKKEFDIYRAQGKAHPMMIAAGIDAIPFGHPMMDEWRANFKGVQCAYFPADFLVTGAVDDLWFDEKTGEVIVVDYKSTSKPTKVNLDAEWQNGYKRQMEIYQWLLRRTGLKVSNTGYFVYCNGKTDRDAFNAKMDFDIDVIPYVGDDSWVADVLGEIKKLLDKDEIPRADSECDYCKFISNAKQYYV